MLNVGNLSQSQSSSIFTDSSSIKMVPSVSAEWNQNLINQPYVTLSSNATLQTLGSPTGASLLSADQDHTKDNFITKYFALSAGSAKVIYPVSTTSGKYYKIVFYAKSDNPNSIMLSCYATNSNESTLRGSSYTDIDLFGWTKIETYIGSQENVTSFNYTISANAYSNDDLTSANIYITVPEVYIISEFDYKYSSLWPTDSPFSFFRPGESYVSSGNSNISFPSNYRRVSSQILGSEVLSGNYYGNKYMPISSITNTPTFTLANVPVPFWKHVLPTDITPYKYFISDTSDNGDIYYSALYKTDVITNKLVFKFNTLLSVPKVNIGINGTNISINGSENIQVDSNGLLVLYWTGTNWSTNKWTSMPSISTTGTITTQTTINKIVIKKVNESIAGTVRSEFSSEYTSNTEYFLKDASRLQIIEVSPRLEIDLTDFVQNLTINKSLDSGSAYIPISSINSNDVSISLSGIPASAANLLVPIFSNQSNLEETVLSGMLIKNIKLYVNFSLINVSQINNTGNSYSSYNNYIPGGVFYSDEWNENGSESITIQGYDISRYLQTLPVPDYAANLKTVFDVITNLLDMSGFTDYDYDSLYKICNDSTNELDLVYYYCNSKDSTVLAALSELFIAHQIGAYIDEYGIMKFLNIKNILSSDSILNISDNSIISNGYSVSNKGKPGKISIRYQPPKIKQGEAYQNASTEIKNSASYIYTTSGDVVWSQQNLDSISFNYLESDMLNTDNSFKTNIPLPTDYFHTYDLSANNYGIIEDEVVSFAYKQYKISNTTTSEYVYVKNDLELQSKINRFIKKYGSKLIVSTPNPDGSVTEKTDFDVLVEPQGIIGNVQRGLFNTKISDHKLLTSMSQLDKPLSQATINVDQTSTDYYTVTADTGISSVVGNRIKTITAPLVKGLIYPTYERDYGYKTYSTKFELGSLNSQSAGLFFNFSDDLNAENMYFLELTKYNPVKYLDPTTIGTTKYILSLYQIIYSQDTSSLIENTVAWSDVTASVEYILKNSPQVLIKNGATYLSKKDKIFNLRLSHFTNGKENPDSLTDQSLIFPGEDEGELVSVYINNVEVGGWQVPITVVAESTATITGASQSSGITVTYTAANSFAVGDYVSITGVNPDSFNIKSVVIAATSSAFTVYGITTGTYVSGGQAIKYGAVSQNDYIGWKSTDINPVTGTRKHIKLDSDVIEGTIFGSFTSTTSIAGYHKYTDLTIDEGINGTTRNGYVVPEPTSGIPSYIREIYACEKPLLERNISYYTQDREFLNAAVQGQRIFKKTYMMQSIPEIIGLNYYDVQYQTPAATTVDIEPIRYLQMYYPGTKAEDQKWWQELKIDGLSLSYSSLINTGYRTKMLIANSSPHLVWLNKEASAKDTSSVRLNLFTHELIAPSDQEIIEKVIDKSNSLEVAQIDSEWIQSKQSALNLLSLIEKSIDGFSKDTSLNIFGNPLIQVGDIIKLTYPLAGVNERKYFVHSVSHSFENGLNTSLILNAIDSGKKYNVINAVSKIEIVENITVLSAGVSQQFTAVAKDQYGNTISTPIVWSASSGSIDQSGNFIGVPGYATITASSGSISGSKEFQVTGSSYSIFYNEQGGSTVLDSIYTPGQSIVLPSAPTRSGYTFNGWFTAQSGGSALTSPYTPISPYGNITLYAQWTAIAPTFTVTFNEQGGSAVNDTVYVQGQSFVLPTAPTRSGYTFNGWYLASTGGTALTSPYTPLSPYGNIVLYAQWTAIPSIPIITSATYGTGGRTGMTLQTLSGGNTDDGFYTINLPYSITFNGHSYNTLYVGTNSYITFGGPSTNYSGLSAINPALDKIMVSSLDATVDDGSPYGGLWFESNASFWRIRYQGKNLGLPANTTSIVWELSSQSTTPNVLNLQIGAVELGSTTNVSSSTGTIWSTLGGAGTGWNITS